MDSIGRKEDEKPKNWNEVYNKWKFRELKTKEAIDLLCLKRTTFYKFINKEKCGDSI